MHEPGDYRIGTALAHDRGAAADGRREPLFLDESEAPVRPASPVVTTSALDLFPDEEEGVAPAALPARPLESPVAAASAMPARRTRSVSVIALFLLAAALAFGAVRACQITSDVAAAGFSAAPPR